MGIISIMIALAVFAAISMPPVEGLQSLLNVTGCGKSHVLEERIRGGSPARQGEIPWVVRISIQLPEGIASCSGSIITPQHVISAAHCKAPSPSDYTVYYGDVEWKKAKTSTIINHFISPETKKKQQVHGVPFEDVLILQLHSPLSFDKSTGAVCLAYKLTENLAGREVQIAGFGATDNTTPDSSVLVHTGTVVLAGTATNCKNMMIYGPTYEICAFNYNKAVCKGDSGGPLMLKRGGIYYQLGTTSYGQMDNYFDKCPGKNKPQIFARISAVRDFILNTVKGHGGGKYILDE